MENDAQETKVCHLPPLQGTPCHQCTSNEVPLGEMWEGKITEFYRGVQDIYKPQLETEASGT